MWACLASMSAYAKELNTAEVAYAAIQEVSLIVTLKKHKKTTPKTTRKKSIVLTSSGIILYEYVIRNYVKKFSVVFKLF